MDKPLIQSQSYKAVILNLFQDLMY